MKAWKKKASWLLCGIMAISCCFTACFNLPGKESSSEKESVAEVISQTEGTKLIYIIGDGMGFNHIENAKLYEGITEFPFEQYYVGEVTTHSANSDVTDSAAAATALATGVKTKNGYVGVDAQKQALENLMEISKEYGKKTGIVTTDTLDGGTPAGFSAHAENRSYTDQIILNQQTGVMDLLLGRFSWDYLDSIQGFEDNGFLYADTMKSLYDLPESDKVVGNMSMSIKPTEENPSTKLALKSMVEYALDFLHKDSEEGFTLMIEGAYIDKYSHSNNVLDMIEEVIDLSDAVEYVLDWASKHDNTYVIFTADHETGGLQKATSKEEISNELYTHTNHTASNVPLYLYNVETSLTAIDNTDVFQMARQIVVG